MARVEYGAIITDIRGSIGGFTFQPNRSGAICRLRPTGRKASSPAQTAVHALHVDFMRQWMALTMAQKLDWNDFADLHTKVNPWGETKTLSGANWFEAINQNRVRMGLSVLTTPPTYTLPTQPPAFSLNLDATDIEIDWTPNFSPTATNIYVWSTPPITNAVSNLRNLMKPTLNLFDSSYNIVNLTSEWETVHKLSWPPSSSGSDFQIAVMVMSTYRPSGINSVGVFEIENYS